MNPHYGDNAWILHEILLALGGIGALMVAATIVAWLVCIVRRVNVVDAHNRQADRIAALPVSQRYTRGGRPRMVQVFGPDAAERRERRLAGEDAVMINGQAFK